MLHVVQPPRGGAPALVELLARAQLARHDVGVVCRPALARRLAGSGVRTWSLPMERSIRPLRDARHGGALVRIARRFRPDVIHAHSSKAGVLGRVAGRLLGIPVVLSPHNFAHAIHEGGAGKRYAFYLLERAMAPLTSQLHLTYEEERRDALRRGLGTPERTSVVPNGVDTGPLLDLAPPQGDPVAVGTYARLWPQKRIDRLVSAAGALRGSGTPFRLVIIGEGPERDALEAQARSLGLHEQATFLSDPGGPVAALPLLDVFVLSSEQEAFPLTPMEAMAAARPVLATAVGAVPEIVKDEITGLLVRSDDEAALTGALRRLLEEPGLRERLGGAGRRRAQERFDVSRMALEMDEVYRAARK